MNNRKKIAVCALSAVIMLVLIIDAKTAFNGAYTGVMLCVKTVVPSLFPFLVMSIYLNGNMGNMPSAILRPIGRLCRLPEGGETILLLGLLGGYPVGAKCIYDAYQAGKLKQEDAHRMLGFCSNAGPAFIFGMAGCLLNSVITGWILWLIHIASAVLTGCILPGRSYGHCRYTNKHRTTLADAVEKSAKTMAYICGWIILFRVIIAFVDRWFLWLLPQNVQAVCIGVLELSNGILQLNSLPSEAVRFILTAVFLGFGGICVAMQTVTVTGTLRSGFYFPGKVIQCAISLVLATVVQLVLFPAGEWWFSLPLFACLMFSATTMLVISARKQKKVVAICC